VGKPRAHAGGLHLRPDRPRQLDRLRRVYMFSLQVQLYCQRFRWYSPVLGRWLQRDPAGTIDGVNLYMYVRGQPTLFVDSYGLNASIPSGSDSGPRRLQMPPLDPRGYRAWQLQFALDTCGYLAREVARADTKSHSLVHAMQTRNCLKGYAAPSTENIGRSLSTTVGNASVGEAVGIVGKLATNSTAVGAGASVAMSSAFDRYTGSSGFDLCGAIATNVGGALTGVAASTYVGAKIGGTRGSAYGAAAGAAAGVGYGVGAHILSPLPLRRLAQIDHDRALRGQWSAHCAYLWDNLVEQVEARQRYALRYAMECCNECPSDQEESGH
jgi:RHS repeat-associated protein